MPFIDMVHSIGSPFGPNSYSVLEKWHQFLPFCCTISRDTLFMIDLRLSNLKFKFSCPPTSSKKNPTFV